MSFVMQVLALLATLFAVAVVAAMVALSLVRRSNEVSSRHRVGAPVRWMASPTRPAALHRRLRGSVGAMRIACPAPRRGRDGGPVADLADEVEVLAAAVDRELLVVARQPAARRGESLRVLTIRVERVETLSLSVTRLAQASDPTRAAPPQWDELASGLGRRIDSLESARREVDALEQQMGLR